MIQDIHLELKAARGRSGLSQKLTAHLVGISAPTLCKIEGGTRLPNLHELCAFSLLFGNQFEGGLGEITDEVRAEMSARLLSLENGTEGYLQDNEMGQALRQLHTRLEGPNPLSDAG